MREVHEVKSRIGDEIAVSDVTRLCLKAKVDYSGIRQNKNTLV
jgi:hypothetical protein